MAGVSAVRRGDRRRAGSVNSRIDTRTGLRVRVTNQMADCQRAISENIRSEWDTRGLLACQQQFDECDRIEPGPLGSETRGIKQRLLSHREWQMRVNDSPDAVGKLPVRVKRTVFSHTCYR